MEKIFKTELNGREYRLEGWFENCHDGFNHFGTLIRDWTSVCGDKKIHYINRTWERFTFESVLLHTINDCEGKCRKRIEKYVKGNLGKKKVTPQVKAIVDNIINGTQKELELSGDLELLEVCKNFRKQIKEFSE